MSIPRAADGDCEGLPSVVLEAMASGTPVVATPSGGISQAIEDGVTGRLVPERDADGLAAVLAELVQDRAQGEALAARALERVQAFAWERIADRYHQVLQAAMGDKDGQ